MKSNKTQLPDLLFLVLHQFLYQQMSFLQLSRISFNIFGKDFRPKFSFFNRFTPLLKPHALNGQNLLNMRKVFCQFSLKCFLKYFFFKNFMTKSCKAFLKIPITDSLVFFSEHISRKAILTEASVITYK